MKVLDVNGMNQSIEQTIEEIHQFQREISTIRSALREVVSLEDSFKGKTADAIRLLYREVHQPLLSYMHDFLTQFEQKLVEMKRAIRAYEPDSNGMIRQDFLQNDVQEGLQKVKTTTTDLVDGANATIRSVLDIVNLPLINEDEVIYHVQRGKRNTENVIEQLQSLDRSQADSLQDLRKQVDTMNNYITDLQSNFQSGTLTVDEFDVNVLQQINSHDEITATINPIRSVYNKVSLMLTYVKPIANMLSPRSLFPITYRNHEVCQKPINDNNIQESETYQEVVAQNTLTTTEEAAIQDYLKDIEENGPNSEYTVDNYEFPVNVEITYWDKREVLGGNSSLAGTPDGLGGITVAGINYLTEDLVTLVSPESTFGERTLAAAFTFTPVRFLKPADDIMAGAKKVVRGRGTSTSELSDIVRQGQTMPRHTEVKNKTSLPGKGEPNSSADLLNPDGTVKQRRYYDEYGRAREDIDFNHSDDGTHAFPHRHKWDWSKTPPRQKSE